METDCDEDLWIWHLFVGCPGSQNDLNVMHASPLYLSMTGGEWPPRTCSYTVNGTTRTLLYNLVNGNFPPFAFFVSPFPDPTTEVETTFNRLQEALRKDVERLYAVLSARYHIALHPARHVTVKTMVTVAKAVAILQNMVTEKRRDGYVSRTRMAAAAQLAAGGSGGGDAVGGGAEGVGNGAVETPAAAGDAAGGAAGDGVGEGGGGGKGFTPNGGAPAAGVGAAGGGAGGGGGGGTGLMPDGGGPTAGVGAARGGAGHGGGGVTGLMPDGGGPAAGFGVAGGGAGGDGGGGTGLMPDGGGPAAGVGVAGVGAAGGGGGGTGLTADGGSHAAGGGAAGGSPQSNANIPGGGDGPPAGVAAPVIAPAGELPAGSFGHAMNAWGKAWDEEEHERLRHDLAEHVWVERSTLLAPYVGV